MYDLTLTREERKAIDWVGFRYSHGHELYTRLWRDCHQTTEPISWYDDADITFIVPEAIAWIIAGIIDEDYSLTCLSDSLVAKLRVFRDQIV